MVVVEDQQQVVLAGLIGQPVDQRRHQRLERHRRRRAEQRAQPLGDSGPRPVQRGDSMAPEPRRVVVARVQRQPPNRPPATAGPVGQHRRLTEPGRGANQDELPRQPLAERLDQARARHKSRLQAGHVQLGGQQHILPGHGNPGRGRHGLVSHRRPTAQRNQRSSLRPLAAAILRRDAPPPAARCSGRACAPTTPPASSSRLHPSRPLRADRPPPTTRGLRVAGRRVQLPSSFPGELPPPVTRSCRAPSPTIPPHAHLRVTTRPWGPFVACLENETCSSERSRDG